MRTRGGRVRERAERQLLLGGRAGRSGNTNAALVDRLGNQDFGDEYH